MKKFILLLLAFVFVFKFDQLAAQDIHQVSTLVLPTSPATSYIVEPGKNVKISSSTSVILTDGTHLKEGSTVRVFIGNTPNVIPAPNNPVSNLDMNWTYSKTYDEDGNVIGEEKSFFDDRGVSLQNQVKSISTNHVLASQSLYDIHGRGVISTLPAPINNSGFSYKPDFVSNSAGSKYDYTNFDGLKTNAPDPLGQGSIGSLGWYYSNNNTFEAYVPSTSFPYSRSVYYNDGTNSVKNSSGIGDELRMGKGRETSGGSFPVVNELDFYSQIRDKYFPELKVGERRSLKSNALQNFSVDQDGNATITVTDLSGSALMIARPDENGLLSINNNILINNIEPEYKFILTTASLVMGGNNPNAGGFGGGPNSFSVNSKYNVKIYRNGSLVFDGIGNEYVHPLTLNGGEYTIRSINPFTVSHNEGCSDCPGKIAESELSNIHYFQLFQAGNVNITGNYELYDMKTEGQISTGFLPKGYYKVRALNGSVNISYTNKISDISFTFYNQLGQIVGNIAPEGVKLLISNGLNSYPTWTDVPFAETNEYDIRGNVNAVTSVDAGRNEFIYRLDGRVRFSQDSEQRKTNRFFYINYDELSRVVESGEYLTGDVTFASAKNNVALIENTEVGGGLSNSSKQNQIYTHYDLPNNNHGLVNYVQDEGTLKSAISWTENNYSKTWYNYDVDGRVSWLVKYIDGLGYKTIDYTYNSLGKVARSDFQKNNAGERFVHDYEYNQDSKLSEVYTSLDGSNKLIQARYYYYLHGPLKRIELAEELQGLDYTYTANGNLKAINYPKDGVDPGKDGQDNTFAPDAFSMSLEYFNNDFNRLGTNIQNISGNGMQIMYNGNVAAQSWKSQKPAIVSNTYGQSVNDAKMYTYQYNSINQFIGNKFGNPDFQSAQFSELGNVNKEYGVRYDANGNILELNRNNSIGNQLNLNYHYIPNTNKLQSVDNFASYGYDDLGQVVTQNRVSGQNYYLSYNLDGKVDGIYADAAKSNLMVSFAYDESGKRIRKTDHMHNVITYYLYDALGSIVSIYDNSLGQISQKEIPVYGIGRIGNYARQNNNYLYELNDNIGNVRVVLNRNKDLTGKADVLYYSDYYPFGSPLTLANNDYRYGYQGQYAEQEKETGWNKFDFRMYDAAIGRWMSTDPKNQYASPYVAMGNNPVMQVDPDGGYSLFKGLMKWAGGFFSGSFGKEHSGSRKGEYFIQSVTGSGQDMTLVKDFGPKEIASPTSPNTYYYRPSWDPLRKWQSKDGSIGSGWTIYNSSNNIGGDPDARFQPTASEVDNIGDWSLFISYAGQFRANNNLVPFWKAKPLTPSTFLLTASNSVDLYSTYDNAKTVKNTFKKPVIDLIDTIEHLFVDPVKKDTIIESVAQERMMKRFGGMNYSNFTHTGISVSVKKQRK